MRLKRSIAQPATPGRPTRFIALFMEKLVRHRHPLFLLDHAPLRIKHHLHIKLITISLSVCSDLVFNPFMLRFISDPERLLTVIHCFPVPLNDNLALLEFCPQRHILARLQNVGFHFDVQALPLVILSNIKGVRTEVMQRWIRLRDVSKVVLT